MRFTTGITIESDALLDPACVDPSTGDPCAGKMTFLFDYTYNDDRAMHDGDRQRLRETLVRAGNTGLTKQQFRVRSASRRPQPMRYLPAR